MDPHFFFFVGFAFILTHEMDAIRCEEWLIFPLTARLNEKLGYLVFTAAHVPLYLLLFLSLYRDNRFRDGVVIWLDIFFIVHVLLHVLFLKHPKNQFESLFSWAIILGAGIAGLLDLVTKL